MQQTRLALIILALLPITGCSRVEDVTADPAYGNFSNVVGTWKIKMPMRLVEIKDKLFILSGPQFVPEKNLAALPVGTEIRVEHLIFRSTFETDFLNVTGSLTSGPNAGKTIVLDDLFSHDLLLHYCLHHDAGPQGCAAHPATQWVVAADKLER